MAKSEKRNESSSITLEEIRVTPMELASMFLQNPVFELSSDKKLVIQNIDTNDFLSAISATDQPRRLQVFLKMMNKLSLDLSLEGSITLGEFAIADHSWTLFAGNSGSLKISTKPAAVVKSITELVSVLSLTPAGTGFPLKANQDLLSTGLSSDGMLEYHRLCQETEDPKEREKGQDTLFKRACEILGLKNLNLRIYGLNASQVDRNIDVNAGGILFKGVKKDEETSPHLILTLLEATEEV